MAAVPKFFLGGATAPCAKTIAALRRTARLAANGFFFNFKSLRTFASIFADLPFTIAQAMRKRPNNGRQKRDQDTHTICGSA